MTWLGKLETLLCLGLISLVLSGALLYQPTTTTKQMAGVGDCACVCFKDTFE